jgi:RNA polymerase sigma-70 factor, ECF subfamily
MDGPDLEQRIDAALSSYADRAQLLTYAIATRAVDKDGFDDLLDAVALRAAAGSDPALELLLEIVHRLKLSAGAIRSRVADEALAEDVAQQVLIAVEHNIGSFGGLSRFRTWLYAVARNESLMALRRRVPEPTAEPRPEAVGRFTSIVVNRMSIADLIESLPSPYRETLKLQIFDDLDYEAIAARLGIPIGTVRSRLSKAKDLLRDAIEGART